MGDVGVPLRELLPAPAQGAVGIEVLADNHDVMAWIGAINHHPTCQAVEAERAFLRALGGDCRSAVAARASTYPGGLMLSVQILSPDGVEVHEAEVELDGGDCQAASDLARDLLNRASPALRSLFAA
jgi:hydroxymethylbilane synthase